MAKTPEEKRAQKRAYYHANRERILQQMKEHREANKEALREKHRRYYERNKEAAKQRAKEWAEANPERRKEIRGKHQKKVKAQRAARQKLRECRKRQCLDWLSETQIKEMELFYEIASWYDEPMHVDHIVPLFGKNVCGLHVPWNLQLLPASDNIKKSNKLLDEAGG